jgi:pimeloyl-ACP methyl ester carboxylesterase
MAATTGIAGIAGSGSIRRRSLIGVLALALSVAAVLTPDAAQGRPSPRPAVGASGPSSVGVAPTRIGLVAVRPCPAVAARAVCGRLPRTWDPTGAVPGTVGIGFAFVPAADGSRPALGTLVAQEGGPGYPSTGSASYYVGLYAPLMDRRNLLMVDQRGTGRSGAIDCPELQNLVGAYAPAAGRCAARLGPHSHLFGTDLASDDLAAVIGALRLGRVDLYGDSYGTFFAQTFAGRHPDLLRSLVLDAAYPTYGEDAWYGTQGPALHGSLEAVCRASAWCARAGGSAAGRFDALAAALRRRPLAGAAPGADGRRHQLRLEPAELALVGYNGTYVPTTYRELDAAIRAADQGDPLPLLRLSAEANFPGGGVDAPADYSEGLDAAVSCRDYPQLFDLTAPPAARQQQLAAAVTAEQRSRPGLYAPFTVREYLASGWSTANWCMQWPVPPADYRPAPPRPPGGAYSSVPTLVLTGTLDTITTPAEGRMVAAQFPRATWVPVPAGLHVTALADYDGCASAIVRDFVQHARVGDTSCTGRLAPLRTAPPFWRRIADAVPLALPASSGQAGAPDPTRRRAAAASVATAADALARWFQTFEVGGLGLRGGRWTASGTEVLRTRLDGYRFVADLAVSGTVVWNRTSGRVTAELRLAGAPPVTGRLTVRWDSRARGAMAQVSGRLGGRVVAGTVLAP